MDTFEARRQKAKHPTLFTQASFLCVDKLLTTFHSAITSQYINHFQHELCYGKMAVVIKKKEKKLSRMCGLLFS